MAPKRKQQQSDDEAEDFEPSASDGSLYSDGDEDAKPKKKAPARKKATPKKKVAGGDGGDADSGKKPAAAAKQPAKKKPRKITEVTEVDDGWTLHPPHLIYKLNPAAQGGSKIAAIDFDGTLVGVKSGAQFPKTADDWKFFNKNVPAKVAELFEQGHQLWIITNQGGIKGALDGAMSEKVRARIDQVLAAINKKAKQELPVQVIMSTHSQGEYHKPSTAMWDFLLQHANKGVQPDLSQCFYIGDAAGRATDINSGADSDRKMAERAGIGFFLPEDKFGEPELKTEAVTSEGSSGKNVDMAEAFRKLADLVKAEFHKARAFRNVADIIDAHAEQITSAKQLATVKGVGKSSLAKITEFLETGTLAALAEAGITLGGAPTDKAGEVGLKFL